MATPVQAAGDLRYGPGLEEEILRGFQGTVRPPGVPLRYRLGLAAAAGAMVLLPAVYLALLGAAVAGAGSYVLYAWPWVARLPGWHLKLVAGAVPPVALLILAGFMLKALFPRRVRAMRPVTLRRGDEPILFAFVERLCAVLGAPAPREICVDLQVNASAAFRGGLVSLVRRDLVLTVGLPLAAGLSLPQLAGILAHELGHFAQRGGMSLSYLVRRLAAWLERVAGERDSLDDRLAETVESGHWLAVLVARLAAVLLRFSRAILRLLLHAGHAVSCFLLRQMELDADRCEARLVGSRVFESTVHDLRALSLAHRQAMADLADLWSEGRLTDSLPALVAVNRNQLPVEVRARIEVGIAESRTVFFDTHPCDRERLANVRREPAEGVFHSELPATAPFRDFPALARRVSLGYYRLLLGDEMPQGELVPAEEIERRKALEDEQQRARDQYFRNLAGGLRALPLPESLPHDRTAAAAVLADLRAARAALAERLPAAQEALGNYRNADEQLLGAALASHLLAGGAKLPPGNFGLPRADVEAASGEERQARHHMALLAAGLAPCEEALARRLVAGLRLLGHPEVVARIEEPERRRAEVTTQYDSLVLVERRLDALLDLRRLHAALGALWQQLDQRKVPPRLVGTLQGVLQDVHAGMVRLQDSLRGTAYPFDHAKARLSLAQVAFPAELPPANDLAGVHAVAGSALQTLFDLRGRLLAALAWTAAQVEGALGLEPLPEPADGGAPTGPLR